MESGNEEDSTTNLVMELEEADEIAPEEKIPVKAISTDEFLCERLAKLPLPRRSASRNGITSLCMDQMIILKKMDYKRLKENHMDDHDCHTHQYEHFKKLLYFLWKDHGK